MLNKITNFIKNYNGLVLILTILFIFFGAKSAQANSSAPSCSSLGGSNLVGYWSFDGVNMINNVKDKSGSNNTGYLKGYTSTTTILGKVGQALKFDGVNNYVETTNLAGVTAATPFTLSVWAYLKRSTGGGTVLIQTAPEASAWDGVWFSINDTGNCIGLTATAGGQESICNDTTISTSTWYFVTATYDGSQTIGGFKLYLNGSLASTVTSADTGFGAFTNRAWRIGTDTASTPVDYFTGYLDEARVYNCWLAADQVQQLYNFGAAKFSLPPNYLSMSSGLVGYWTFDGKDMISNVKDKSGSNNNGYLRGYTATTTVLGKVGQALKFGGVNNYVSIPQASSLDLSGDATFSGWFKLKNNFNSSSAVTQIIMEKYLSDTQNFIIALVGTDYAKDAVDDGSLVFKGQISDDAQDVRYKWTSQTSWKAGQWYHFTAVLYGSSGDNNAIYINAVDDTGGSTETGTLAKVNYASDWNIGGGEADSGQLTGWRYFDGSLDDVRIYNRALSATEVLNLYNFGSSKVSASPKYAVSSGLIGYWTFDGQDMIDNLKDVSGNDHTFYLSGFTSTTTTLGKIGQALRFDRVNYAVNPECLVGSGEYTISAWIKPYAFGDVGVSTLLVTNYLQICGIYNVSGESTVFCTNDAVTVPRGANGAITLNKWHYFTAVRNSSNQYTFYINGAQTGTANQSGGSYSGGGGYDCTIGMNIIPPSADYGWNGLIDDLRVYGRALSTAEIQELYNSSSANIK
jgi:hypothetical protein